VEAPPLSSVPDEARCFRRPDPPDFFEWTCVRFGSSDFLSDFARGRRYASEMTASDLDLVRQYTREQSEDAFAELVSRHLDLVYSAALRQVRSPQLAEEVSQCVFIDLSRNASRLNSGTVLTAWLYQVTRRTAIDVVRRESRRQAREQLAFGIADMNSMNSTSSAWPQIEPLLDEAMDSPKPLP